MKEEKPFDRAISVLKAATIILFENRPKEVNMLDKLIYDTKANGLEFAIQCLEEAQKP